VSVAEVVPIRPLCTIGGSEIAAAAGVDPYRSRVALWLEKTGRLDPPETEAMRWGELLEPAIWNELEDRGYELTVSNPAGLTDPERPWLVGHPDGFVAIGDKPGVLEIKTASPWVARHEWADGGAPLAYAAQLGLEPGPLGHVYFVPFKRERCGGMRQSSRACSRSPTTSTAT
jgi:putative phage-type endonuclease